MDIRKLKVTDVAWTLFLLHGAGLQFALMPLDRVLDQLGTSCCVWMDTEPSPQWQVLQGLLGPLHPLPCVKQKQKHSTSKKCISPGYFLSHPHIYVILFASKVLPIYLVNSNYSSLKSSSGPHYAWWSTSSELPQHFLHTSISTHFILC